MQRLPSCCDFCGLLQISNEYPTDHAGVSWFACVECVILINDEDWDELTERSLAAYTQIRPVPEGEEAVRRQHVENIVQSFRAARLVQV